jgi:exo-beta-1,3-glucanase (GH17 family)
MITSQISSLKKIHIFLFTFILISIVACDENRTTNNDTMNDIAQNQVEFKQDESDLLIGISKAICYSGFRTGQHPDRGDGANNPSYKEILEDLQILAYNSNFELIRIYDSGENSELILKVIEENKINIKVMLGIWLKAELSNHETCAWLTEPIPQEILDKNKLLNKEEINRGIQLANQYKDIVVAINVGNEALVDWNDHKVSTDSIISYVQKVKKSVSQLVTVAENYKWWADHGSELAKVVDFLAVHVYPVWEGKDIHEGMSYSLANIKEVHKALPDSKIVISEAGWASVASEFGERASEEKQEQYCNELLTWAKEKNVTVFLFEAFDEDWKGNPDNMMGAEKHWGLFTIDRKPKKVMSKLYSHLK